MKNVLFICGKARKRSPTAAQIASKWPGINADFAGLSRDADEQITAQHLDWADMIFVMEARQKKRLATVFGPPKPGLKPVVLNIADRYEFMEQALIDDLMRKLVFHFGPLG